MMWNQCTNMFAAVCVCVFEKFGNFYKWNVFSLFFSVSCYYIHTHTQWLLAIGAHSTIAYLITHSSHTAPKCMFVMVSKDNFNEIVTLINGQTHFITIFSKYIFLSFYSIWNFIVMCVCVCVVKTLSLSLSLLLLSPPLSFPLFID